MDKLIEYYYEKPIEFAEDILEFIPDDNQKKIFNNISNNRRISVKSGAGVGKSASIAAIVLWYIFTRYNAKVIVTSPSMTQLYSVLWKEIAKWRAGTILDHIFTQTKTMLYETENSESHFAIAKTSSTVEGMSGFHEENLLIIADEASGIKEDIMDALLGTMTDKQNKIVLISNPTRTEGTFYDSFNKLSDDWVNITINAETSKRVDNDNIKTILKKCNNDKKHPLYRVRVLGEFPDGSQNAIIPRYLLENNTNNEFTKWDDIIIYSVDIAKGTGGDNTVIYKDDGTSPRLFIKDNRIKMMGIIGRIIKDIKDNERHKRIIIMVDETGIGIGLKDRLEEVLYDNELDAEVYGCHNGSPRVFEPRYYSTQIGEMFYNLKELLESKKINVEDDYELIEDLSSREIAFNSNGKITAEPKDRFKKRIGRSPDNGDSFLLCVYGRNYI